MTQEERFWAKVDRSDGDCWLWTGYCDRDGYGHAKWREAKQVDWLAHRLAFTLAKGPIPEGLTVDHLCRNRACVNPGHLEACSLAENVRRGSTATKTHCKHGHEFTPENTYYRSEGTRACRKCQVVRSREYRKGRVAA